MGTELGLGVAMVEVWRATAARDGKAAPAPEAGMLRRAAGEAQRMAGSAAGWLRLARPAGARTGTAARGA